MRSKVSAAVAAIGAAAVAATAGSPAAAGSVPAAPAPPGRVLFAESFTTATADPRLIGYGAACLTGARPGGPVTEAANHPLGGCHPDPAGPVPPSASAPRGYLQLTDAHVEETGAVMFDSPIPTLNGLQVTFEQWQYGNTTRTPADGISFFLTDGAARLTTPGAFGGSLGYAQRLPADRPGAPFIPGVERGYLGIGLDVLGDYFGDGEGRGNGCTRRSPAGTRFQVPPSGPNIVTARGPGNGVRGYCFLDATTTNMTTTGPWPSSLPGRLHADLRSLPPGVTAARAEALLEPAKRVVRLTVPPGTRSTATVDIDFRDGKGFQRVLSFPAPQPIPSTVKFGFASSTGPNTDVNLIRRLTVRSLAPSARAHSE